MGDVVPNYYLRAVRGEQCAVQGDVEDFRGVLGQVVGVFHEAWQGGQADVTGVELEAMRWDVEVVAAGVEEVFAGGVLFGECV